MYLLKPISLYPSVLPFEDHPQIGAGFEQSPLKGVVSKTCHVANADGGEAMLFDGSGAARSAKARGHGPV